MHEVSVTVTYIVYSIYLIAFVCVLEMWFDV